jgi:Tfx family DNA-binding protein
LLSAVDDQVFGDSDVRYQAVNFSRKRHGFLTEKQSHILFLRLSGYTQLEIARELKISRASVSMIEGRARRLIQRARQTVQYFDEIQRQYGVRVDSGTRLQQVPMIVLQEADNQKIHLRSNMVEILRLVKKSKANSLGADGRLIDAIEFRFNARGKLTLVQD